jgi:predicted dehydrogenase
MTGGQPYTDYRAMLQRPDLDAIYVSLPVFAHGAPEMAVIERGLPFLVEKPVALDLGTAKDILAAVRRAGVMTCVGYQLRYCGSTDAARECLSAADAGPIGIAAGTYWCGTGRSQPDHWRTRLAQSGGQLVEQATHTIDMMRYLVGEVAEVFAYYGRQVLPEAYGDCPDVHAVALRFAGGAVGTLSATWAIEPTDWGHANLVNVAYGEHRLHWRATGLTVVRGKESHEYERPDQSIDQIFVEAVRSGDGRSIRSDYAEAVHSLAVSLAANESARTGAPVPVPTIDGPDA